MLCRALLPGIVVRREIKTYADTDGVTAPTPPPRAS